MVRYDRSRAPGWLRDLCPAGRLESLAELDPGALTAKAVLLDVDHTLLAWRSEEIPPTTTAWLEAARGAGLKLAAVSNTRFPERTLAKCQRLGIPWVRGARKPDPRAFLAACEHLGVAPAEAVAVGDQLFNDVLGANRAGVEAYWVRPLGNRDFLTTAMLRPVERWIFRRLEQARADR